VPLKRTTKRLLQQLHQHQPQANNLNDSDDGDYDEIDFQVAYRRPTLVKCESDCDELSDYVKFRLYLARQLALMKYQKAQG
jgi:hypothetical protein